MMKEKTRHIIFYAAASVLIGVGIHLTQEFRFYNIAANDLFIYDCEAVLGTLAKPGGLATLIASFLSQFFCLPVAGTLVLSVLYLLCAWLVWTILSRVNDRPIMKGLAFLPVVFLFLCMENDYYRFQGHIAFMLTLAALYAYGALSEDKIRYAAGILIVPMLYHLAGSSAMVFAVSAFMWEVLRNGFRGLYALIYPVVSLLTVFVYVKTSMTPGWEHVLTPFMYYDWPSTYFFPLYAWASVPVLMLAARLLVKGVSRLSSYAPVVGLALALCLAGYLYNAVHSCSYYRLIQEQHLAEEGEWDEIIESADRRQPNYLVSYLNLALAHKGQLVDKLGYYNPQPVSKVMFPTPNLKTGLSLQSAVYLSWGYVSAARQAAFDANMVTPGMHNPAQLKILVLTNMALGSPEVAEKYVNILAKTLFHRGWAREMRQALDEPAYEPEELRRLREALPYKGEYVRYDGLKGDMKDILEADSSNEILSQFYTAYQMLETLEER
jgi:hypothetical protein